MLKQKKKAILAPPYSGTLYAYFDDCMSIHSRGHREAMGHPYYKNLYRMYTEHTKDIALTLSVLYDQVIIPPADAAQPDKGLGFSINWDEFSDLKKVWKEKLEIYKSDVICELPEKLTLVFLREIQDMPGNRSFSAKISISHRKNCSVEISHIWETGAFVYIQTSQDMQRYL